MRRDFALPDRFPGLLRLTLRRHFLSPFGQWPERMGWAASTLYLPLPFSLFKVNWRLPPRRDATIIQQESSLGRDNFLKYHRGDTAIRLVALYRRGLIYGGMARKEKMMTVKEAASQLGSSEQTIRTWLKRGRFPGAKLEETPLGSYWLIPQSAVDNFTPRKAGRPPKSNNGSSDKKKGKAK